VVDAIESRVDFAEADLARVARALGATARTVQRRLEEERTSFREVVDGARRRHAESMLASRMPAARVAEALGFADTRSLRRAAARWAADVKPDSDPRSSAKTSAEALASGKPKRPARGRVPSPRAHDTSHRGPT
jgi:AraC-like DNA-binding protein